MDPPPSRSGEPPPIRRARVLVTGLKGGVGKTTVTCQLAASLTARGLRVLVVDLDPQAHATFWITGLSSAQLEHHTGTVLSSISAVPANRRGREGPRIFRQAVLDTQDPRVEMLSEEHRTAWGPVSLLPGHTDCAWLQFSADHLRDLAQVLDTVEEHYDVVLLDSAPSAWALTLVGLYAAQSIVAVTTPKAMSLYGLNQLFGVVGDVRKHHPQLELAGIVANLVRRRHREHEDHLQSLREQLGDLLVEPYIGGHTAIEQAEGAHLPLHSMGGGMAQYLAQAFDTLTHTLITKEDT